MNDERDLYWQIERLFAEYCGCLDEGELERWPELFVTDGCYKMISRENHAQGLVVPLIWCDGQNMMRDRIYSLRNANIYQPHTYRHAQSGIRITTRTEAEIAVSSSYIVVQTLLEGTSEIFQAGSFYDRLVNTPDGLRFRERLVIYDTSRIKTLLATPI